MELYGTLLSERRKELYKDYEKDITAISLDNITMKKFVFKGIIEDIMELCKYVKLKHNTELVTVPVREFECLVEVLIEDNNLLTKFPRLKAMGFVQVTNKNGNIIGVGVLLKDSGFVNPNQFKLIEERNTDFSLSRANLYSRNCFWPLYRNAAYDFKLSYKYPNNIKNNRYSVTYKCPYKKEWYDGQYIFEQDGEYYEYRPNLKYVVENGVLLNVQGYEDARNIVLPKNIVTIGERAFEDNQVLISVKLSGVKNIGESAFSNCGNLKQVIIGSEIKSIGSYAFAGCPRLSELDLPDSLKEISVDAFYKCGVERIKWPKSITKIPTGMFKDCPLLYEIEIPPEVTEIGRRAFNRANTVIIKGVAGSVAEKYANENGLYFKAISNA